MPRNLFLILIAVIFYCPAPIYALTAIEIREILEKRPIISEIKIIGLWRTKPSVIRRELLFQENDRLAPRALFASEQRLKNLLIFSKVSASISLEADNRVKVIINIQEKWTTIPYFNISGGGGTTYIYTGIYDFNTFGRFIESSIQYDNRNGRHGGIARIYNPRFLNKRLLVGLNLQSTQRSRQLYNNNANSQGSYILERKKIGLIYENEINPKFHLGTEVEFTSNRISEFTTNALTDTKTKELLNNHNNHNVFYNTLFVSLGKLDHSNYLIRGKFTKITFKYSNQTLGASHATTRFNWFNRAFWHLPYHANFGLRLNIGWTNTKEIQNLYYIGGFSNVRGYLDGQFRSKTYWQFNAEYRIPSYRSRWLVLQHVFFIDAASTGNNFNELKNNSLQVRSAGIGLRIISPKIYAFNGRIDVALFSSGNSPSYISFGSQQYF